MGKSGFENLDVYKLALKVVQEAYRLSRSLPPEEKYNLANQIRRAAVSVTLNIAEGYGRYHYLDSLRFYYIARGSLEEVLSAFIVCDQVGHTISELPRQRELCSNAVRALNGYIRYVRNQKRGQKEYGDHAVSDEVASYETDFTPSGEE
ncbi:MAG: four helix bundle protein [Chloroflexota bacterium]|nr:four helix bundle protein [Chloroflexota bacterium]